MRKDPSTFAHERSEFIQGGSHDDSNTSSTRNINGMENIVGDCEITPNKIIKNRTLGSSIVKVDQRDEKSLMEIHHQIVEEEDNVSVTLPTCCGSSQGDTSEDPLSLTRVSVRASSDRKGMKCVRFGDCSIRSYNQILGDHPSCADGCPVALGWNVVGEECFSVDDHEIIRIPLRKQMGPKSPNARRRKRASVGDEPSNTEPSFKYMNSQLKLNAHERRDRLRDYSDAEIRKEWSRMSKQSRRAMIKEGLRQFRMVGMHYAGY